MPAQGLGDRPPRARRRSCPDGRCLSARPVRFAVRRSVFHSTLRRPAGLASSLREGSCTRPANGQPGGPPPAPRKSEMTVWDALPRRAVPRRFPRIALAHVLLLPRSIATMRLLQPVCAHFTAPGDSVASRRPAGVRPTCSGLPGPARASFPVDPGGPCSFGRNVRQGGPVGEVLPQMGWPGDSGQRVRKGRGRGLTRAAGSLLERLA